jgi:hypothetical protein
MDEVDSIGSARTDNSGGSGDSEVQRTMLELLNQLDGFEATNKIKVGGQGVEGGKGRGVCVFGGGERGGRARAGLDGRRDGQGVPAGKAGD